MNIVIGRGSKRVVHELPAGGFIAQAAKAEPREYQNLLDNVCVMLGIIPRNV